MKLIREHEKEIHTRGNLKQFSNNNFDLKKLMLIVSYSQFTESLVTSSHLPL